jgi:hypothetical protein
MYKRIIYNYDSIGNNTEVNWYDWDVSTNDWFWESRFEYQYDEYGNRTQTIHDYWDYETGDTLKFDTTFFAYDANGNQTEHLLKRWDYDSNDWVWWVRNFYTYDADGKRIEEISYNWDAEIKDCVKDVRRTSTYDTNGNRVEKIEYEWDSAINDWSYYTKEVSYWSKLTTSIANKNFNLKYLVYPNPTQSILTIETDIIGQYSINITSLNGQLLYIDKVERPTHQIDLSLFEKGLYFITIRSRDYVWTKKIIKQ